MTSHYLPQMSPLKSRRIWQRDLMRAPYQAASIHRTWYNARGRERADAPDLTPQSPPHVSHPRLASAHEERPGAPPPATITYATATRHFTNSVLINPLINSKRPTDLFLRRFLFIFQPARFDESNLPVPDSRGPRFWDSKLASYALLRFSFRC